MRENYIFLLFPPYWLQGICPHLGQVSRHVCFHVQLANNGDVVAPYHVQAQHILHYALLLGEYTFVRFLQDDICGLVEAAQHTDNVAAVVGDDGHHLVFEIVQCHAHERSLLGTKIEKLEVPKLLCEE